ncbi:MAG: hypothetical protein QOH32_2650 [Bradyrhizobium sp.]|jgi:hypothetical protein|nr:hypothetical protein [Bradyrhizobium sp.]
MVFYIAFLGRQILINRLLFAVTLCYGVLPCVMNAYLAYEAFIIVPKAYAGSAEDCYWTLLAMGLVTLPGLIGFIRHGLGPKKTLAFVIIQSAMLILCFAGFYRGYGLCQSDTCVVPLPMMEDKTTSLYFSIVTWTTLGYGDYLPPHDIKLLAAAEALLGNLSFGLAVGLVTDLVINGKRLTARRKRK